MKKTLYFLGCLTLLAAGCNKIQEVPADNPSEVVPELKFNITANYDAGSRAVKRDWAEGDKIYLAFDVSFNSEAPGYVTLTYDGTSFGSAEVSNSGLQQNLLNSPSGKLAAIYLSSNQTPEFQYEDQSHGQTKTYALSVKDRNLLGGFILSASAVDYTISDNTLTAALNLTLNASEERCPVHFFLPSISEGDLSNYTFSCTEFSRDVFMAFLYLYTFSSGPNVLQGLAPSSENPILGSYYDGGIEFVGYLNPGDKGVPTDYLLVITDNQGTPDDASDDIIYSIPKTATLNGKEAFNLPELSSDRWSVTEPIVPKVNFWLDPDSTPLITEANFDSWIPEVHFNNQFGFVAVNVGATDFSGDVVTMDVTSDSDEWLWCYGGGGRITLFTTSENTGEQPRVATITVTVTSEDGIDTVTRTIKVYQDGLASPIKFASQAVKGIAVSKWDTNADGELSYAEAAAVESLDGAFKAIPKTTEFSFDELEFFTELTEIGDYEFEYLSLTSIRLPGKITRIGYEAFIGTMIEEIYIPEGVTELSYFVFDSAPLKFLNIPASLTHMWSNPVIGCEDLATLTVSEGNPVYTSPEGSNAIIWIDTDTGLKTLFAGCKNTVIPDDVEAIGYNAFSGCSGLQSIEIPNSVQLIQPFAFAYSGLKSVVIPASVTSIGFGAFYHYSGESELESIIDLATTPQVLTEEMLGLYDETFPIYVPTESVGAYKGAWQPYQDRIQGMVSVNFDGYHDQIEW